MSELPNKQEILGLFNFYHLFTIWPWKSPICSKSQFLHLLKWTQILSILQEEEEEENRELE